MNEEFNPEDKARWDAGLEKMREAQELFTPDEFKFYILMLVVLVIDPDDLNRLTDEELTIITLMGFTASALLEARG